MTFFSLLTSSRSGDLVAAVGGGDDFVRSNDIDRLSEGIPFRLMLILLFVVFDVSELVVFRGELDWDEDDDDVDDDDGDGEFELTKLLLLLLNWFSKEALSESKCGTDVEENGDAGELLDRVAPHDDDAACLSVFRRDASTAAAVCAFKSNKWGK